MAGACSAWTNLGALLKRTEFPLKLGDKKRPELPTLFKQPVTSITFTILITSYTSACEVRSTMDSLLIVRKDQTGITIRSDESNESHTPLGLMGSLTAELADIIRSADFDSRLECLLERRGDLNETFANGQTILHHLALTKPLLKGIEYKGGNVAKCVSVLAERKVNLEAQDDIGCTALHYAAQHGDQPCSDALIKAGADLCIKNKAGESALKNVLRHLPNSLLAIEERLDRGITLRWDDSGNLLYVLLDFNVLLSKKPHDDFLSEILEDAHANPGIYNKMRHMEKVFLHPLTECFLNFRWNLIRRAYWTHLLSHIIFSLTYSAYVYEVYSLACNPMQLAPTWTGTEWINGSVPWNQEIPCDISKRESKSAIGTWFKAKLNNNTMVVQALWLLLVGFIIIYTVKDIGIFAYTRMRYLSSWENRLSLLILITFPFIILHQFPTEKTMTIKYYQYHVAAVSVFITWTLNMLYIAYSPVFGHYVHMMVKISINFFKFFIAISSLLIAFATSFTILFPREASVNYSWTSPLKALSMMAGEIGYNDLMYRTNWIEKTTTEGDKYLDSGMIPKMFNETSFVILNIFIVIFPVIIMNLFFGIAVNDVQSIINEGKIHQKKKMVKIIKIYEKILALHLCLLPPCLHKFVKGRQVWFNKEVVDNICEVDLNSQGSKRMISRCLIQRLMVAVERVQNKDRQPPTLDDIMKKMETLEQRLDEKKSPAVIDIMKMFERLEQKLDEKRD